ncbi:MAG: NYN domain-containing protein [Rhodoferax sp.]|nr:NYN domain-containing protein [Rhodoferax sp.]
MNVFLIDADNLSASAWVDEAFRVLEESEGVMPVRRAYGSAENLKGLADVLRVWAVRPFVNLSLTKNTTDIALAVDAMEFACQTPMPKMIVIGSGDADFVPLVVRLRERGIRMVCVSERGKMGREAVSAYDSVILVGQEQALHEASISTVQAQAQDAPVVLTAASTTRAKKAAAAKAPAKKVAAKKVASKTTAAKKAPGRKAVAKKTAPSVPNEAVGKTPNVDVAAILQAMPALQTGQPQSLGAVAKALLDAKLRGKNMTSTKLLKKFPFHFELLPAEKPNTVQYRPSEEAS